MSASAEPTEAPTKQQVEARLVGLVRGEASREEVAEWAGRWVRQDNPNVDDPAVWKAVVRLSGADMITIDRPYLYDENDFGSWLRDLRGE